MSITHTLEVECDCGASVEMLCCDSVNAERHPHLREALLERRLHAFECGACGLPLVADKQMTYIDLRRQQLYAVAPERERARERELSEDLMETWRLSFGDRAPASVSALFGAERFHVRLCFGLEELREKVVCRDADLSDLALEVYKAELLATNPAWANAGVRTLRFDHVEPDGRFAFAMERATDPPTPLELGIVCARERYDELAATPWRELLDAWPGIASGPYVSLMRLAESPSADEAAAPAPDGE